MISRKEFLKQASLFSAGAMITGPIGSLLSDRFSGPSLTILYTNDTHARLDPFPQNAREFAGLGGIAERASLVKKIRSQNRNVLLLDAGDVFQGTPWFDVYGGAVDLKLMTEMNYDAMAIGNHEFDRGLDGFAEAAQKSGFPILASNYFVRDTPLNPFVQRQLIKEFDGFRVGIFGLGIRLQGVVDRKLYGDVRYFDPVQISERMVQSLRGNNRCDYVICLSHLGYYYDDERIDDHKIAKQVSGIDLIIGGHTHTFLDAPVEVENPSGGKTHITQMGHSGVRLGRLDVAPSDMDSSTIVSGRFYTIGRRD
ncbi:MAG: bifunctional metallophosphatase/5'-nucleotidase [Balneolaceae bacterium]|nr:MAG: bifunctional metallophosphatase/5'-nucleotidase [Balneolaceae bacterium]